MTGMIGRCFMNHYRHCNIFFCYFSRSWFCYDTLWPNWKYPSCILMAWLKTFVQFILGYFLTQQHNPQLVKLHRASNVRQIGTEKYCGCEVKRSAIFVPCFFLNASFPWISCQNSKDGIMCKATKTWRYLYQMHHTWDIQKSKWRLWNIHRFKAWNWRIPSFHPCPKRCWNLWGKQPECKTRLHWLRGSRDLIRGTALSVRNAWETKLLGKAGCL